MRSDLGGDPDPGRPGALDGRQRGGRADVADVHGRVLVLGDVEGAGDVEALAERRDAGEPEPRGDRALVHLAALEERLVLGVDGHEAPAHLDVLEGAAYERGALQYVKVSGRFVAVHAQDESLFKGGQMHEGPVSARLGLTGIPSLCESLDVSRTLDIAEYEDAAVHICHVSTAASLAAIERARAAGVRVTAEVTPHHLTLNDEAIAALDPNFKMNPPLRAESDRKALVAALKSGLLDCVATDHAPHAAEE